MKLSFDSLPIAIKFLRRLRLSIKEYLFILPYLIRSIKLIDYINESNLSCKQYVALNSSVGIESFLSLYFKSKGIPTYSLQHGMYYEFKNTLPYDFINYENICADKLLAWGKYTSDQISTYATYKDQICIYGFPFDDTSSANLSGNIGKILILLPRSMY